MAATLITLIKITYIIFSFFTILKTSVEFEINSKNKEPAKGPNLFGAHFCFSIFIILLTEFETGKIFSADTVLPLGLTLGISFLEALNKELPSVKGKEKKAARIAGILAILWNAFLLALTAMNILW